jgi:hypothetical protein
MKVAELLKLCEKTLKKNKHAIVEVYDIRTLEYLEMYECDYNNTNSITIKIETIPDRWDDEFLSDDGIL